MLDDLNIIKQKQILKDAIIDRTNEKLYRDAMNTQSLHTLKFTKELVKKLGSEIHDPRDLGLFLNLINSIMLSITKDFEI